MLLEAAGQPREGTTTDRFGNRLGVPTIVANDVPLRGVHFVSDGSFGIDYCTAGRERPSERYSENI